MAIGAVVGVALKVSSAWQRFKDRHFVDDEVKPSGWLARTYGWMAPCVPHPTAGRPGVGKQA